MPRCENKVVVLNKLGLHARPATQLALMAQKYAATITLFQGDKQADASSVLGLMMLESSQGKEIRIVTEGEDAQAAIDAVSQLFAEKFNEQS